MSQKTSRKTPTFHNVSYMMYKNISEQIFDALFFVYLTKYIYECIEQRTPYTSLVKLIVIFCLLHIVVHFVSAGLAYYQKLHNPIIYQSIFDKIIQRARKLDLVEFERPGLPKQAYHRHIR